jgi:hypothetical protein
MKGVYFLIAVALFVACAFVFINEHGKFYESFDGTTTGAMANSQTPTPGAPPPSFGATGSGTPTTTTSNTTPLPSANDTPQTPGSTTANPAISTPSQNDMMGYIDAVAVFAMGVNTAGGKTAVLAKLSPEDVSYFNTLYTDVNKITQYAMAPVTFPYTSAQTVQKTKEYTYANKYITVQLPQASANTSTMRVFVEGSITHELTAATMPTTPPNTMTGVTPPNTMGGTATNTPNTMAGMGGMPPNTMAGMGGMPPNTMAGMGGMPPNASTLANGGMMGGGMPTGNANVGLNSTSPFSSQTMFSQPAGNTTTVTGTAGGQGNQPLSGQFTMNGTNMSDYLPPSSTSPEMFAKDKKDAEMCDASNLQELIGLIKIFEDGLKSLSSSEPVIVARIQQIDKLLLDLNEIKQSVKQGKLAPDQIPIRVGDARKFLKQSSNLSSQLPNLITLPSTPAQKPADPLGIINNLQPGNLLDMAKYLKGSISLSFDGDLYVREQMAQRVDKIVNMLQTKQITSSDAQNILQALTAIQGQLGPAKYQATNVFKSPWQAADIGNVSQRPGYMPDVEQLNKASNGGDDDILPGSDSNSYLKRASAAYAAYSYNDLTTPDFKDKLVNLCANVTKAGLDMGNIGCTNIQNVSPEYGYKGAYLMVCNRLKDTWGGSYPQMFGCPTSN